MDSLRAVTGVDERKVGGWLTDGGRATGSTVALGAGKVGQAGKAAGGAVAAGAQKAGQATQTGLKAYLGWLVAFWTAIFNLVGWLFRTIWLVISFIPRKIVGLFSRKENKVSETQN
jgi:hypothetical protein